MQSISQKSKHLLSHQSLQDIIDIVISTGIEILGNDIDPEKFKDHFYDQYKSLFLLLNSRIANSDLEMQTAVDGLLKMYDINNIDNGAVLKKCFYELSGYDKLIEVDGQIVPVLLSQLFDHISVYKEILAVHKKYEKTYDSIDRTIALSTSHTPDRMLAPLNPYMKNNIHNGQIKPEVYKNIIESYIEDSYATDFALSAMRSLGTDSLMNIHPEKITAFNFASRFANSSLQVHRKDIINSLRIAISMFYLKDNFFQKQLRIEQHISHDKLAINIDLILSYLFNIDTQKKKTDPRRFKNKIQIRTHFDTVPLYEYARKGKEKVHPAFEDEEFLHEFQEKIKGKISKISSVPNLPEKI